MAKYISVLLLFLASPCLAQTARSANPAPVHVEATTDKVRGLIEQLNNSDENSRIDALEKLGAMGCEAKSAITAIDRLLLSPLGKSAKVRAVAIAASEAIDPPKTNNATKQWGKVVEERKPAIYLYPQIKQRVVVSLPEGAQVDFAYPPFTEKNGWNVTVQPDGYGESERGERFNYLFWEGKLKQLPSFDRDQGAIIAGSDAARFFEHTLEMIGLNERERFDFIVYWAPEFAKYESVYVNFILGQYTDLYPLNLSPQADSKLQMYMVYKPVTRPWPVRTQEFRRFERKGFTVVEWGGGMLPP